MTGLIWEVKTHDDGIHDYMNQYTWYDPDDTTNGGDSGTSEDERDTQYFIDVLNVEKLGGFEDWRIPTIMELAMLVNADEYNPSINETYFPSTYSQNYWSSTTYASSPNRAWVVCFNNGYVCKRRKSAHLHVRAVRGGQ